MSDFESDYDEFEEARNDPGLDDWEQEDDLLEEKKRKQAEARAAAEAKRGAAAAAKARKQARLEAAKGNVADDELDDENADVQREFRDRLEQFEVEQEFEGDEDAPLDFEALPIASMHPENERELLLLGKKLGKCIKTFRHSKMYFYALNMLLMQTCEKVEVDDMRSLASKLAAKATMREKVLKSKKEEKADRR